MPTPEQLEIHALAREFAEGEIRPHVERWDAARELPDEIFRKLAELGFMGMRIPAEHGGLELDAVSYLLALEALAWGDAAVALSVAIHNGPVTRAVGRHGTPAQQARWLPSMASGETLGAFALSEADAGSDPSGLRTTARRDGDGWRLEGRKRWVTGGGRAGLLLVFARTGAEESGKNGISAFLVPRESDGIAVVGRERTLGLAASDTLALAFDEVHLPDDALLGGEGGGWDIAMDALVVGRAGIAAQSLGIAQAAYEHALRYAAEREQFGQPLDRLGGIREKLAGMAIRIAQARALALEVASGLDAGPDAMGAAAPSWLPAAPRSRTAMAKVAASEAAYWVADEAVQIFGGYGYMRDYPVEKLMRDAKGTEIYEGANEVLAMLVAVDASREARRGN